MFILDLNAIGFTIGAVLSQIQSCICKVLRYFRRAWADSNHSHVVSYLFCRIDVIHHLHHYLYGRKVTVQANHTALQCPMSSRMVRNPGHLWLWGKHGNADDLNRRPRSLGECRFSHKTDDSFCGAITRNGRWERDLNRRNDYRRATISAAMYPP